MAGWPPSHPYVMGLPFQRPRGSGSGVRGPDTPAMTRWVLGSGMTSRCGGALPCSPSSRAGLPLVPLSPESSTTARGTLAPALPPTAARSSRQPTRRMCASFTKVRGVSPIRHPEPLFPCTPLGCGDLFWSWVCLVSTVVFLTGSTPEEAVFGVSGVCLGRGGPWKMAHPGEPGVSWEWCGGGVSTCAQHLCWDVGDRTWERWGSHLEEVLYSSGSHMPL